ncbi:MAG: MFS transporter [Planctomycetota bacterium]|jgi:acyl-[acyl-carrier-protein]-phospholipid O-acyltransferase/long-chain-fatty-acid--[acyl-carrier-protein] ligase
MDDLQANDRPPLLQDQSFWGLAVTQFLGAFNDNLYKQMMLLMAIPGVAMAFKGGDRQGWATALFSLPFVLLSSYAGFLSDRYSKSRIIVLCKFAEVGITLLAVLAFLFYGDLGDWGTWSVLLLMGIHSTFFGPGKYGILPELFRKEDAPRANGLILMSTFLAIILGVVLAGVIKDWLVIKNADGTEDFSRLWIGSLVCTGVAVVGTICSMFIRNTPPAQPDAQLVMDDFVASEPIRKLFARDNPLLLAIIVSSIFWLIGGIVMPVVNAMGKVQMGLMSDGAVSVLTGGLAIGIILGAVCANLVLKKMDPAAQVRLGMVIMILAMVVLGFWLPGGKPMLGYAGSLVFLIIAGIGAAVFVIPLQVFLQQRPPAELKGRMIATMNFANFVGILVAGPLYQLFLGLVSSWGWPVSSIFWLMSLMLLPCAVFYRLPKI